jgi:transposase
VLDKARALRLKLAGVLPFLNEKQRRVVAAAEAKSYGRGGVQTLARVTGICRQTIYRGLNDLAEGHTSERVRNTGGGRKKLSEQNPELLQALEGLIAPATPGDPESPLKWTCKSVRNLEQGLKESGHAISYRTVATILHQLEYSLQSNRKTSEGKKDHPDRDEQFQYINNQAKGFLNRGAPVISVDTKKKELIGKYKNSGREWGKKGRTVNVLSHDFPDSEVPKAKDLLICADSGGSNGYRLHLWKREMQRFVDQSKLRITVCHFPPGTSKWNKVEHRLFSYISMNWRGRPLTDYQTVVSLIAATTTRTGLIVKVRLDKKIYQRGIKVSAKELKSLKIHRHEFHGEWNYTIEPRRDKV